jgi:hypothetical protein
MKLGYIIGILIGLVVLSVPALFFYFDQFANPRIVRELMDDPDGERARRVMLLSLPSGRQIPVNYLREDDRVYAAADGSWWKELDGEGFQVTVFVRGESLAGLARAVRDDPDYTKDVFSRLRPTALPGFGTLIEVRLDSVSTPARSGGSGARSPAP